MLFAASSTRASNPHFWSRMASTDVGQADSARHVIDKHYAMAPCDAASNISQALAYGELDAAQRAAVLKRPRKDFGSILSTVAPIVEAVEERGDAAVIEYTEKFDGVLLDDVVVGPGRLG